VFRYWKATSVAVSVLALALCALSDKACAVHHVYEVVEEAFRAENTYENPYLDVDLWVTLTGPGGTYRIPAFWDGGNTFRARLVATQPGNWKWSTGDRTGDSGLDNKSGSFNAVAWTQSEKMANPNRRGFIRVAANKRTLRYADGTPFFYTGDTWWAALTRIYSWNSAEGESQISFQDALALRKAQGFNGINMIACFPTDTLQSIWASGDKTAEDGATPFEIREPGDRHLGVDYTRINPAYWRQADRKWRHMWENGFVPYLETVRRHERWPDENAAEKKAFTNYVRYLWARWGCYNMIFSWLHMDAGNAELVRAWRPMLVAAHAKLRDLPYGQPKAIMCPGSSLRDWYSLWPRILDVNSVSNQGRDGASIGWLREMFFLADPLPVFNIEPYYPGVAASWHPKSLAGMTDGQMAQSLMYGCVLGGGALVGHAWGDCYWGGVATSPKSSIPEKDPHKNGFNRWTAASMGKLRAFVLDGGHDYRVLVPAPKTHLATPNGELLSLALAPDKSQALGFISAGKEGCDVIKLIPNTDYRVEWWHIDDGGWQGESTNRTDGNGRLRMSGVPGGKKRGWAYRILRVDDR